ncbi:hypothetical protein NE848_04380 [Gramella jeungdoensis]|uniref:DUF1097 domain-containing protein n=1 Tax=Gramella jeungdoensis TaxID=708091 RepID=A0ABT0Z0B5_9FLAO|nr:hypothetical protein [Gramella jeungdoensis]MCM8568602.1 hypothetical protein [Gramella jeungdoensis]
MRSVGFRSAISRNQAWVSAAVTGLVSFVLPFLYVGIISLIGMLLGIANEGLGNFLAYLFTGITVAIMCFLICRAHPESLWYTPVICNASTLVAGVGNYFGGNPDVTLPFAIGWVLSVIAAIWGTRKARGEITKDLKNLK